MLIMKTKKKKKKIQTNIQKLKKPINNVFLTYASDTLTDNNLGLTSSETSKYFSVKG